MVVKLKAYRLAPGYKEERQSAIVSHIVINPLDGYAYFSVNYTRAQIDELHGLWGLRFRRIYGYTSGGTETAARILDWDDEKFTTTGWSLGYPSNYLAQVDRISVVSPIIANEDENINISNDVIEQSIEITKQIESLDKFDLRISRCVFEVDKTDNLKTFLDKYWNPTGFEQSEYIIGIELEGYFWGFSDFENINYDEITQTYHFDCYDPIKWLQKNIWSFHIPSLGISNANLNYFLTVISGLFYREGKTLNIDVNDNQNWDYDYVGGYDEETQTYFTLDTLLSIEDFIVEILKHYGAIMFYDESGNLNFIKRETINDTDYDEDNMLEELNRSYQTNEYDGIVLNVIGAWKINSQGVYEQWEGWVLIWEDFGVMQSKTLSADLSEIPENFRYLDLRQKFPDYTFEYRIFAGRTREEVYTSYKELLRTSKIYETTLDGINYNLFDTININGDDYIMNYLQKNIYEENTKARLYRRLE